MIRSPNRAIQLLILAVVGWYLLLVTLHYFNQRPLWNDEQCVFNSIKDYSPAMLFSTPLANQQQFPRVHLYVIQLLSSHADFSLLSLRLLSFIFMLGAFFMWMWLALRQLADASQRLSFALCWAGSIPLIYYGAELKPYSMDVCATAVFLVFLWHQPRLRQVSPAVYAACLMLLPWLGTWSYATFLMFVFPLYNIIRMKGEGWQRDLVLYLTNCLTVVGLVYWFDVRVSNAASLKEYWRSYFISFNSVGDFFSTTFEGINNLISRWFAEQPKWIRMVARFFVAFGIWEMMAGFKSQLRQDNYLFRSVGAVALIVFLELYLLAVMQMYAFSVPRTSLFFAPMVLFLTVKGFQRLGKAGVVIRTLFLAYLLWVSIGIAGVIFQGDLGAQSPLNGVVSHKLF